MFQEYSSITFIIFALFMLRKYFGLTLLSQILYKHASISEALNFKFI